jgi:septal ring factor EnvC (AmiA/AmiB activator)
MKIGTVILLLLLSLFGSGFLLNQTMHLTDQLNTNHEQLAQLQLEKQTLEVQYQALLADRNQLAQSVERLSAENTDLYMKLDSLEAERNEINARIDVLQNELDDARAANPLLAELANVSSGRMALALLVVPILPLSISTLYMIIRQKNTHTSVRITNPRIDPESIQTALTREELHLIAQRRRSKTG